MARLLFRFLAPLSLLVVLSCSEQPPARVPIQAVAAVQASPPTKPGKISRMGIEQLYLLQQSGAALIYDARPAIYYHLGHIPGAISFPKNSYTADIGKHEPELSAARAIGKPVVIYCTDAPCPDALKLATRISRRGDPVTILEGGWEAWKTAQLPTE